VDRSLVFDHDADEPGFAACLEQARDPEAADVQLGRDIALRPAVEVVAASHTRHQHQLRWPGPHVDPSPLPPTAHLSSSTASLAHSLKFLWRAAGPFFRQRGSPITPRDTRGSLASLALFRPGTCPAHRRTAPGGAGR